MSRFSHAKSLIFKVLLLVLLLGPSPVLVSGKEALAAEPCDVRALSLSHPSCCSTIYSSVLKSTSHYCIQRSRPDLPFKSGEAAVFFLHGIIGNQEALLRSGFSRTIETLANGAPDLLPMTFVTFSTAPASFFTDWRENHTGRHAYRSWIVDDLIPWATRQFNLCSSRQCRAIAGYSMGGGGALSIALQNPRLFSVCAVAVPALAPRNIFGNEIFWNDYWSHSRVGGAVGMTLLRKARADFGSAEAFDEQDPMRLAAVLPLNDFPALYIEAAGKDQFGFAIGYQLLQQTLFDRGVSAALADRGSSLIMHLDPSAHHYVYKESTQQAKIIEFISENLSRKTGNLSSQAP